jgi:hypothetical protein
MSSKITILMPTHQKHQATLVDGGLGLIHYEAEDVMQVELIIIFPDASQPTL